MPFDTEDKNPSLGDPSAQTTTPLNQKQMVGAQQAAVNRTQLPTSPKPQPGADRHGAPGGGGKTPQQVEQDALQQLQDEVPVASGAIKLGTALGEGAQASHQQADDAIGLNPAHQQDWWRHALESPVETFFLGKHIYNAFYGAFLDPNAIQASVHDIWHQDNAVGWLLRNQVFEDRSGLTGAAQAFGTTPENVAAGGAGLALPMGADPTNLLFAGPGARGAMLVAKFLAPGAMSAIFTDRHGPTDLAWAIIPAAIFGGKLPAPVAAQVEKVAPGALKLIERMTAAKMAQDANKTGVQDRENLVARILKSGTMGPKDDPLAPAWQQGMKDLTKEQHYQLVTSLMERYGSLDLEKVMAGLVRDGASSTMLRNVWTRLYKQHYALPFHAEGEGALVDPLFHRPMLPAAIQKKIADGYQWTSHMVHQAYAGPAGHDADPNVSRIRSMLGTGRSTLAIEGRWISHLKDVVGDQATNPQELDLLGRSIEATGREAEGAYQALSPEMKYVRDSIRLVAAASGMALEELGQLQRVHGYLPRVGLMVKAGKGFRALRRPRVLTTEPSVHRALKVTTVDMLTETRLQVEQAYKTVKEANEAVGRQRTRVVAAILHGTPWHEVLEETGAGIPQTDLREIEGIQAISGAQPDVAKLEAEEYAKKLIPEFSENPFDSLPKFGRQVRAAASQRAIEDLLQATDRDGRALAVVRPGNNREAEKLARDGYKAIAVPGFQRVLVNEQYGKLLEQMSQINARKLPGGLAKLLEIEGTAVGMIMFAPRIHGINMAGRLAIAMTRFGPDIREWLHAGMLQKGGGTSLPPMIPGVKGASEVGADDYRIIAHNDGVIPPNPHAGMGGSGFARGYIQKLGEVFGDTDIGRVPLIRDMSNSSAVAKAASGALAVGGKIGDTLWGKQSELWQWVSDFGVMMYWVELAEAMRSGRFADAARKAMEDAGTPFTTAEHARQARSMAGRYAATRANSWMGHVTPEDTNPMLHAVLKSAIFAPAYWRTWAELLTGYYRNAGFGWSHDTIRYVVENEVKTAAAAVLFQQLSANALNLAFSGHTIYQNDPGNLGKVEITAPWAIAAHNEWVRLTTPKDKQKDALIDEASGRDAKGRKLTWENPAARQMTDTEGAMGLLTSSPQWSPDTFAQGFSSFAAARTSPVMQALAALGNVDLYRSISSDGLRYVDPNHDSLANSALTGERGEGGTALTDLITAGGDLTPFSGISQQIQQQVMQGNVGQVQGPFGTQIPQAVVDAFKPESLAQDASKAFLAGMTGVNPPYMRSSKTPGRSPTDDQYKAVHEIQDKYQQQMNSLSTSTLSGQMAPYQWLATYRQLSAKHSAEMQAIFLHAPEYSNGPLGLTNSWEGLYDRATDKNGVLQPDKLRSLQHEWRSSHSAADYAAVQNELHANDSKYPMLQLYHKTKDAYDNWQSDWAKQNGVDLTTLQNDLSGWSYVYNDRAASRQWLVDHPEITQFENAKRNEFESGQSTYGEAGLMYALFFNPTAADRYLTASGETAQEVEQAVQEEQVPAAP